MNSLKNKIPHSFRVRYGYKWHQISDPLNLKIQTAYSKIKRQFVRPPFPQLENGEINVHLGCGSVNHPKFINIDGLPAPHIHYIKSIDNLSLFKENTVDLIYACHCLEHFSYKKIPSILREWFRVIKKGGHLRLSVPNFDLMLAIYQENDNDINTIIGPLMGGQEYKYDFHMTAFNQSSLEKVLIRTGFMQVIEWQPGSNELTTFDDWSGRKILINGKSYPISLNLEASK